MSACPFFYIEVFNYDKVEWEKFDVYAKDRHGKIEAVDLWPWNGSHDLFSVLGCEDSYDIPTFYEIHRGMPPNVSNDLMEEFKPCCCSKEEDGYNYEPRVSWFNLADALLYLERNGKVVDQDEMDYYFEEHSDTDYNEIPKVYKSNPLKELTDRVSSFISIGCNDWGYNTSYSDVRVIYWLTW